MKTRSGRGNIGGRAGSELILSVIDRTLPVAVWVAQAGASFADLFSYNLIILWGVGVGYSITQISSAAKISRALININLFRIESLRTCVLYTVLRMEGGAIYWWGVLPLHHRKKLLG